MTPAADTVADSAAEADAAPRLLIVEDEAVVALDLRLQLQELGYRVVGIADSAEQAQAAAQRLAPQLVLMDVRLRGEVDGIAAAQRIRERDGVPVIFLTSHTDDDTVRRAAATAPYGYLTKPFQVRELRAGIEVALTKSRMERQLREADRWFAHTLQCVADGVIVTDTSARVRFLNPAAEALTGWRQDEAAGRPVAEVVQLDAAGHGAAPQQLVSEVLSAGRPAPVVHSLPLRSRSGRSHPIDETAGPVRDERGEPLGAVLVLRDAAPRLAHEAQLRASEARFRQAFDHAPLGMALVSQDGSILLANDALCELLQADPATLASQANDALTVPEDRAHERERLAELAGRGSGVVQFEKRYRRAGGEPLPVLVSVSQLHDDARASCLLYQVHDLSAQKRAAEALAALTEERIRREASELADAAKSDFLARASHEMRTPLNAVIGFAQLLRMGRTGEDPQVVGRYAAHIHAAGEHLLALVNDLLDLNRAGQGQLRLQLQPVALAEVVNQAVALVAAEARAHGIGLQAAVPEALQVRADPQRLRQVLLNLLSNAIKYNRQGGDVRIGAAAEGGAVVLSVVDGGIGMTPEQVQRLFRPFERLGAERTAVPGTGLGLVIARSLLTEMGATIVVDSAPRAGTTVRLAFPAGPPAAAAAVR